MRVGSTAARSITTSRPLPASAACFATSVRAAGDRRLKGRRIDRVEELHQVAVDAFGNRPVLLVGSSFGGQVALDYALADPQLDDGLPAHRAGPDRRRTSCVSACATWSPPGAGELLPWPTPGSPIRTTRWPVLPSPRRISSDPCRPTTDISLCHRLRERAWPSGGRAAPRAPTARHRGLATTRIIVPSRRESRAKRRARASPRGGRGPLSLTPARRLVGERRARRPRPPGSTTASAQHVLDHRGPATWPDHSTRSVRG
jgi:pimeloyl-ACP methyl ester carboxylesterase